MITRYTKSVGNNQYTYWLDGRTGLARYSVYDLNNSKTTFRSIRKRCEAQILNEGFALL